MDSCLCRADIMRKTTWDHEKPNLQSILITISLGVLIAVWAPVSSPSWAQESTSFQVREHRFSGAGASADEADLASSSYLTRPLGAGGAGGLEVLESTSFTISAGSEDAYLPPGEISELAFLTPDSLLWNPEPSAGLYHLYRGQVSDLTAAGTGICHEANLTSPSITETDMPGAGTAYFYLVTVENRLGQEGTKGSSLVAGVPSLRANSVPCP